MSYETKIASPFAPVWRHMFGWSKGISKTLVRFVEYDWRPASLEKQFPRVLIPDLWQIVSEYVTEMQGPLYFELWRRIDDSVNSPPDLNWYGPFTYGTSWFKGCKVWLTPRGGFVRSIDYGNKQSHDYNVYAELWNCTRLTPFTLEEFYDTTKKIPIRCKTPLAMFDTINTYGRHGSTNCDCVELTNVEDTIAKFCENKNIDAFMITHCSSTRCRAGDAFEGDARPSTVVIFNGNAVRTELTLVEELAKINHKVTFRFE